MGIEDKTPAEKAGIDLELGRNKRVKNHATASEQRRFMVDAVRRENAAK